MDRKRRVTLENVDQMSWDDGAFKVVLGEVPDVSLFEARENPSLNALPGEDSGALVESKGEQPQNPS